MRPRLARWNQRWPVQSPLTPGGRLRLNPAGALLWLSALLRRSSRLVILIRPKGLGTNGEKSQAERI